VEGEQVGGLLGKLNGRLLCSTVTPDLETFGQGTYTGSEEGPFGKRRYRLEIQQTAVPYSPAVQEFHL